jgi:hypothetical protein
MEKRTAYQDLLVLTDGACHGRHALALPFQQATVIELNSGDLELNIGGTFDAVAVDRSSLDLDLLNAVAAWARPVLPPHGHLVVALGSVGGESSTPSEASRASEQVSALAGLAGFRWQGLTALNGRPCAVLQLADRPAPGIVAELLTTADTAARIAARRIADRCRLDAGRRDLWRQQKRLRQQVDALTQELEQVRRDHRGHRLVRTVLRRSRTGRVLLRVLRPAWRLARAARSAVRKLQS